MSESLKLFEIGSEEFEAFQSRLASRNEGGDISLGGKPTELMQRARDTGDTVVTACEAYRKRTAAYPRTLADLVPTELPAVPDALALPLVRRAFRYRTTTDGFELDYPSPLMTLHLYTSAAARWQALD